MKILKRNGTYEKLSFDRILYRIRKLANDKSLGVLKSIDPDIVAQRVVKSIYDGISSWELDEEAARISIGMTENGEYQKLAARLVVSNLHKSTIECFSDVMEMLWCYTDESTGRDAGYISDEVIEVVRKHKDTLNYCMDFSRDYNFDYFGFKTLERSYLLKMNKRIQVGDSFQNKMVVVERPQHMYLRVALGLFRDDIPNVLKTYDLISRGLFTFASPTLFNSATRMGQLSSCFLLGTDDSIDGIFKTITDCAKISKVAGGIGVHVTNIRGKGSLIRGTHGSSDGIIPMLKVYNDVSLYINQSGKRKGSFACFVKDTKVCTINKGVKNIQDVEIGDLVVTHKNRIQPVEQIHKNLLGERKIYKVSVMGNKDIYVTGNHKFWSFYTNKKSLGWNSVEELKLLMDDDKKTTRQACYVTMPTGTGIKNDKEQFIDVLDYKNVLLNEPPITQLIEINNQVKPISETYDRNNNLKIANGNSINRKWIINEDLANLFGIWLGNGHVKKNKNYIRGIGFTVHKINHKLIDYIVDTSKIVFGCNVTLYESKKSNVVYIDVNSHIVGKIFTTLFGGYFNGKKLPDIIFSWPSNLVNSLLAGLITTDGHIAKKSNITLGLSNEHLMTQIYHLCRNNGIKATYLNKSFVKGQTCCHYTISIESHKDITNKIYKLYYDNRIEKCSEYHNKDYEFLKILSITETDRKDEYVYTLGVKEDHSYNVEGLLVENCYIEPWHVDIWEFLDLKKNQGHDNVRARDLFYALWIPDLFMKCVEDDIDWYLMCPDECPNLHDTYGEKFEELYNRYITEGKYRKKVRAQDLWFKILEAQIETGTPYMLYKDAANRKSNQRAYGTIRSSNLCVHGNTPILTRDGYIPIKTLENRQVDVWNGVEWSTTTIQKTGESQTMLTVHFSNGGELVCTPYHKFYDKEGIEIRAVDLQIGTSLMQPKKFPVIGDQLEGKYNCAYTMGYIVAERVTTFGGPESEIVPVNGTLRERLDWISGFIDYLRISEYDTSFGIPCVNLNLLSEIRLLLNTLGISPQINLEHRKILLSKSDLRQLQFLGLKVSPNSSIDEGAKEEIKVIDVDYTPIVDDTYCFREERRGMGIFGGILTGQCSEIILYSDSKEISVCNLASIALPKFVDRKKRKVDFELLKETARYIVRGMNRVIDVNYYSVPEAEFANKRHRPIGVGVQGLHDLFILMRVPFESDSARQLNKEVFEAIYYGCVEGSVDLAEEESPYETYRESPSAEGKLQFDLWAEENPDVLKFLEGSRWDWNSLKERMKRSGLRNCALTTCMPTASTAQILGNTECIEPIDSCIFKRRVLSGDFTVINKFLVEDLQKLGLWSNEMKDRIILDNGSIQNIPQIPDEIKALYKTVWEISQKTLIDYSADRGPFIDHSQSLNLFVENPTIRKLSSMHFYGWKRGLKTGMYYLRSKTKSGAAKFSVDANLESKHRDDRDREDRNPRQFTEEEKLACSLENREACEACSG